MYRGRINRALNSREACVEIKLVVGSRNQMIHGYGSNKLIQEWSAPGPPGGAKLFSSSAQIRSINKRVTFIHVYIYVYRYIRIQMHMDT